MSNVANVNSLVNSVNNAGYWKQDNALQLGEQGFSVDKNQKVGSKNIDDRVFVKLNVPTERGTANQKLRQEVDGILRDIANSKDSTGAIWTDLKREIQEKLLCKSGGKGAQVSEDSYKPLSVRLVKGFVAKAYGARAESLFSNTFPGRMQALDALLADVRVRAGLGGKGASVDKLCKGLEDRLGKLGVELMKAEDAMCRAAASVDETDYRSAKALLDKAVNRIKDAYASFSADLVKLQRKLPGPTELVRTVLAAHVKAGGTPLGQVAEARFNVIAGKAFAPGMTKAEYTAAVKAALTDFIDTEYGTGGGAVLSGTERNDTAKTVGQYAFDLLANAKADMEKDHADKMKLVTDGVNLTASKSFKLDVAGWKTTPFLKGGQSISENFDQLLDRYCTGAEKNLGGKSTLSVHQADSSVGHDKSIAALKDSIGRLCGGDMARMSGVFRALQERPDLLAGHFAQELGVGGFVEGCNYDLSRDDITGDVLVKISTLDESSVSSSVTIQVGDDGSCSVRDFTGVSSNDKLAETTESEARKAKLTSQLADYKARCDEAMKDVESKLGELEGKNLAGFEEGKKVLLDSARNVLDGQYKLIDDLAAGRERMPIDKPFSSFEADFKTNLEGLKNRAVNFTEAAGHLRKELGAVLDGMIESFKSKANEFEKLNLVQVGRSMTSVANGLRTLRTKLETGFVLSDTNTKAAADEIVNVVKGYAERLKTALVDLNNAKDQVSQMDAISAIQEIPEPEFTFATFTEEAKTRMLDNLRLIASDFVPSKGVKLPKVVQEQLKLFSSTVNTLLGKSKSWLNQTRADMFCTQAKEIRQRLLDEISKAALGDGVSFQRGISTLLSKEYENLARLFQDNELGSRIDGLRSAVDTQMEKVQDYLKNPGLTNRKSWNDAQLAALDGMKTRLTELKDSFDKLDIRGVPPKKDVIIRFKTGLDNCMNAFFAKLGTVKRWKAGFADSASCYFNAADGENWKQLATPVLDPANGDTRVSLEGQGNPFVADGSSIKSFGELARLSCAAHALSGTKLNVRNEELRMQAMLALQKLDNCPKKYLLTDDYGNLKNDVSAEAWAIIEEVLSDIVDNEVRELAETLPSIAVGVEEKQPVVDLSKFLTEDKWNSITTRIAEGLKDKIDLEMVVNGDASGEKDGGIRPGEVLKRGTGIFGIDYKSLSEEEKNALMKVIYEMAMYSEQVSYDQAIEKGTDSPDYIELRERWLSSPKPVGKKGTPLFGVTAEVPGLATALFTGVISLKAPPSPTQMRFLLDFVQRSGAENPAFNPKYGAYDWYGQGFHTTSFGTILQTLEQNGISLGKIEDRMLHGPEEFGSSGTMRGEHLTKLLGFLFEVNHANTIGLNDTCVRIFGKDILQVTEAEFAGTAEVLNEYSRAICQDKLNVDYASHFDPVSKLPDDSRTVYNLITRNVAFGAENAKLTQDLFDAVSTVASKGEPVELAIGANPKQTVKIVPGSEGSRLFALEFTTADENGPKVLKAPLSFTMDSFLAQVADDFVSNPKLVGIDRLKPLLPRLGDQVTTSRTRQVAMNLITGSTGLPAAKLSAIPTGKVLEIAHALLPKAHAGREANLAFVESLLAQDAKERKTGEILFNGADTLELYERMQAAGNDEVSNVVYVPDDRGPRPGETPAAAQRRQVHEFVSELVQPQDTTKFDLDRAKGLGRGAILRQTLLTHRYEVCLLLNDSKGTLTDDFSFRTAGGEVRQEAVTAALRGFVIGLKDAIRECGGLDKFYATLENGDVKAKTALDKKLEGCTEALDKAADTVLTELQKQLTDKLTAAFRKTTDELKDQKIWKKSLDQISAGGTLDVDSGYGRFLMEAVSKYFSAMEDVDRSRMVASLLRVVGSNSSSGDLLGALIKGAGPVFQKLMQGLPQTLLPDDLREAVKDLKSNLPPIPREMVRATLFDMVRQSNGVIKRIELKNSLGAATVGQTFLCTVYTKDNPAGEECVVKILRPDAQNRARREYDHFLKVAEKTPGMEGSFASRLDGIFEELDFTQEAKNVKKGSIYNSGVVKDDIAGIRSMELHAYIPPTVNAMVVRKAQGTTYDRFTSEASRRIDDILKDFKVVSQNGYVRYECGQFMTMVSAHNRLRPLYNEILARQKMLVSFSEKWTFECIFGDGFAHMDVHSGNLMCDDNTLTVIDYGNALTLTKEERKSLKWALSWMAVRDTGKFMDYFRQLLPKKAAGIFDKEKTAIATELGDLFARFDVNDAGRALAAAMHIVEQHGVPLPGTVFGIMQSLQRLDESIRLMNEQLDRIQSIGNQMTFVAQENGPEQSIFKPFENFFLGIDSKGNKFPEFQMTEDEYKAFTKKEGYDRYKDHRAMSERLLKAGCEGQVTNTTPGLDMTLGHLSVFYKECGNYFKKDENGNYPPKSWCAETLAALDHDLDVTKAGEDRMLTAKLKEMLQFLDAIPPSKDDVQNALIGTFKDKINDMPASVDADNAEIVRTKLNDIFKEGENVFGFVCSGYIASTLGTDKHHEEELWKGFPPFADSFDGFGNAIGRGAKSFAKELSASAGAALKSVFTDSPLALKNALEKTARLSYMQDNRLDVLLTGEKSRYGKFAADNLSNLERTILTKQADEFRYPTGFPARMASGALADENSQKEFVEMVKLNLGNIQKAFEKAGLASRFSEKGTHAAIVKYTMIRACVTYPGLYEGAAKMKDKDFQALCSKLDFNSHSDARMALETLREIGKVDDALTPEQTEEIEREFSVLKNLFSGSAG